MVSCEEHVTTALRLSGALLELANEVRLDCGHTMCAVLDGVIHDSAMRIARAARDCNRDGIGSPGTTRNAFDLDGEGRVLGDTDFSARNSTTFPRKGGR